MVLLESAPFTRRLQQLAGSSAEAVLRAIENDLLRNPAGGRIVPGLGGIRKGRVGDPGRGKGKRGGLRYLYLYLEHRNHIHLLFLLSKGEQEDLSATEREQVRALVAAIKQH